ncbi:2-deoxystreptamine glucosyltransferase [Maioricimonas rarisocia]|uniref:2-deoxystreptamine glucosyltransferase n=1 Tax=Maioricimonas rarisocia TaxID=2528026 RepID=A0A517Z449_9PLAN|nr:glycosyltransferase family 4 protein [Maioricimonas rarisocia]QDU37254.1 2-deoxystreptamine glucosyltransferase [Maioricimonas rarisocia]
MTIRSEQRLTVLQVLPALDSGGVERGTLEVAEELVRRGHRSTVVSAGGRMVNRLMASGSEHFSMPIGAKSPFTLRHVPAFRRLLLHVRPDILHVRSRMPAWIAWLAWRSLPAEHRPRFLTTAHGMYSVNRYSAIMTRGEKVIAVSNTIRDYLLQNYPALPEDRIHVIHRGVAPETFPYGFQPTSSWKSKFLADHPRAAGKPIITLPGRITRLKGHPEFLDLMNSLKNAGVDAHGLIVGGAAPGKERYLRELEADVASRGLSEHVTFTGHRRDIQEIFSISQMVLSLSRKPESFGRTVLEAINLGVPVIGHDMGGVGEVLAQLFPSGRVPPGDAEALCQQVRQFLEHPPEVPQNTRFTLQEMLDKTLDIYDALTGRGGETTTPINTAA